MNALEEQAALVEYIRNVQNYPAVLCRDVNDPHEELKRIVLCIKDQLEDALWDLEMTLFHADTLEDSK